MKLVKEEANVKAEENNTVDVSLEAANEDKVAKPDSGMAKDIKPYIACFGAGLSAGIVLDQVATNIVIPAARKAFIKILGAIAK